MKLLLIFSNAVLFSYLLFPPEIYYPSFSFIFICCPLLFIYFLYKLNVINQISFTTLFLIIIIFLHSFISPYYNLNYIMLFVNYLLIFIILQEIINEQNSDVILKFIIIASLIISLYAIYQFFWGYNKLYFELFPYKDNFLINKTLFYLKNRRVTSTFALPTAFASFQLISIPWIIYLIKNSKSIKKILFITSFFISLFSLFLSQSYFIIIGLFIMIITSILLRNKFFSKKTIIAFLILIVVSASFSFFFRKDIPLNLLEANTIKMRISNWRVAKDILFNNLFWGVGLGNFHIEYPKYMHSYDSETKFAHNFLLQFSAELGIFGILFSILMVSILLTSMKKIRKRNKNAIKNWALCSSILIFLFYSLIDISFYFPSIGFYGILIISIYASEYRINHSPYNKEKYSLNKYIKLILLIIMVTIIIYGVKLNYAEKLNENAYQYIMNDENEKAISLIKEYTKYIKSDVSASEVMLLAIKNEKSNFKKVNNKEFLLTTFSFSPKTHYLIAINNLNEHRYYDAFIHFSIAYQLYPIKGVYKNSYLQSLKIINSLKNKYK